MEKLISVIVPIYNVDKYLDKCIASICGQIYSNLQIILVDDGSEDSSGRICDLWKQKDSRIEVIHKKNGGLSDARNAGIALARGEILAFVDSDDWIEPEMYQKMMESMYKYKADIVICGMKEVWSNQVVENVEVKNRQQINIWNKDEAMKKLAEDKIVTSHVWNKIYNRNLFFEELFMVGKAYEDIYIMHEIFGKAKKVVYTNDIYYNYLQRESSILGSMNLKKQIDLYWAYKKRYEYLLKYFSKYNDYVLLQLYYTLWGIIRNASDGEYSLVKEVVKDYNRIPQNIKTKRNYLLKIWFKLVWCLRGYLK